MQYVLYYYNIKYIDIELFSIITIVCKWMQSQNFRFSTSNLLYFFLNFAMNSTMLSNYRNFNKLLTNLLYRLLIHPIIPTFEVPIENITTYNFDVSIYRQIIFYQIPSISRINNIFNNYIPLISPFINCSNFHPSTICPVMSA